MTYVPSKCKVLMYVLVTGCVITTMSCAHYATTQENIQKVNDVMMPPATPTPPPQEKKEEPKKNGTPGSIPLAVFLDSKAPVDVQSVNPWYTRVLEWTRNYRDIAIAERDVRNFKTSEKFSQKAWIWSQRAVEIKKLQTDEAAQKVRGWLDQLLIPALPDASPYFTAQDAYSKIVQTREAFYATEHRMCLISEGIPLILTLANLDLAIDLYKQTKYAKSLYKVQIALATMEHVESEEKKCSHPQRANLNEE